MSATSNRGRSALASAVTIALVVGGCTTESENGPEPAAEQLAEALGNGKLGNVAFVDTPSNKATAQYRDIADDLESAQLRVRAGKVEQDEDTAEATLRYDWQLGDRHWRYRTTARLVRSEGTWRTRFAPSLIEPSLRKNEALELVRLSPERGDIVGANQQRLVTERPVFRFGIDKTKVDADQQEESARSLAELLDIDADNFADQVSAAGDQAFVEAIVLREGDVTPAIDAGYREIDGATALEDEIPLAPTREFARPILGTVGSVTAEIIEEHPDVYEVGDEAGLSGLQKRYENRLRGASGFQVRAVATESAEGQDESDENDARELFRAKPRTGKDLGITLDPDLQQSAEQILTDEVGSESPSALVAIRPSDGHVLAAADGPGSDGVSTSTIGQYPPGSTFKVATTLALLRSGATGSTTLPCPTTLTVHGKNFENYDAYPSDANGDIPLRTAFANSCNTSFIGKRADSPPRALADAAASLGLGVDRDLGFGVYLGSVPTSATPTGKAAATIGQGKVLSSPLAMATVAASVAHGETVVPQLVTDPQPKDANAKPEKPLTSDEADQLQSLMRGVVTEGSGSFLADVPGEEVIAKTGTAEFERDGELQTHAWMIAAQGDLAVAAFVELGESGSATAGPLVEQFLREARQY